MALKDIPHNFDIDSEEDVRIAIAAFFRDIGFGLDEISFEDHFTIHLGHKDIGMGTSQSTNQNPKGYSDILITRQGVPLAIIEVKRQNRTLTDEDAWQAISYARLLRQVAPFAIVTNGINTRVYDTLASGIELKELSVPSDSTWYHSGCVVTISEDLKHYAAKKLIGINVQTLLQFCQAQINGAIGDFKGSIRDFTPYVPELYLEREGSKIIFEQWLENESRCFAIVGESGGGKTNFMCATAENQSKSDFVLYYSAINLQQSGIVGAITNDFVWEFRREQNIAQIIDRFNDLAIAHKKKLIIFIDGLDEFTFDTASLRAELIDLSQRLSGTSIRLCVSCKSYNWHHFVITPEGNLNRFARTVFPSRSSSSDSSRLERPKETDIGYWLDRFTESELDTAFAIYKSQFSLTGDLDGNLRSTCQTPLWLRLMAEVYFNSGNNLPTEVSSKDLFDEYWERSLSKIRDRITAELLLFTIARIMVDTGEQSISRYQLSQEPTWSSSSLEDLLRQGLVKRTETQRVLFGLNQLRNYIFAIHVNEWSTKPTAESARQICELLSKPNPLHIEAIDFFLRAVDRGVSDLLLKIAIQDVRLFGQLIDLDYGTTTLANSLTILPSSAQDNDLNERLKQYAHTYIEITRNHFSSLNQLLIVPIKDSIRMGKTAKDNVAYVISSSYARQYTELSTSFNVNDDFLKSFQSVRQQGIPIEDILRDLQSQLPQKIVWRNLMNKFKPIFREHLLDESSAPQILQERAYVTLTCEPHMWYPEYPDQRHNFHKLNFSSKNELHQAPISDLIHSIEQLIKIYFEASQSHTERDSFIKWNIEQVNELLLLHKQLDALSGYQTLLGSPLFELDHIFQCINNPNAAVPVLQKMIPDIMVSYRAIAERNFPLLSKNFALLKYGDAPILIEVGTEQSLYGGNTLKVSYILLPTVKLPQQYTVYSSLDQHFASQESIIINTFRIVDPAVKTTESEK